MGESSEASIPFVLTADPVVALNELVAKVTSLNLHNGVSNSLDAKLSNALSALEDLKDNNNGSAINKIEAFINEVEAQAARKQTPTA
jgi:hypothetical protein